MEIVFLFFLANSYEDNTSAAAAAAAAAAASGMGQMDPAWLTYYQSMNY